MVQVWVLESAAFRLERPKCSLSESKHHKPPQLKYKLQIFDSKRFESNIFKTNKSYTFLAILLKLLRE